MRQILSVGAGSGARIPNAPVITAAGETFIDDNASNVINSDTALTANVEYEIEIIPETPTDYVRVWLCTTTATRWGGLLLHSGIRERIMLSADTKLYVIRDSATPLPYKVALYSMTS